MSHVSEGFDFIILGFLPPKPSPPQLLSPGKRRCFAYHLREGQQRQPDRHRRRILPQWKEIYCKSDQGGRGCCRVSQISFGSLMINCTLTTCKTALLSLRRSLNCPESVEGKCLRRSGFLLRWISRLSAEMCKSTSSNPAVLVRFCNSTPL